MTDPRAGETDDAGKRYRVGILDDGAKLYVLALEDDNGETIPLFIEDAAQASPMLAEYVPGWEKWLKDEGHTPFSEEAPND